MRTKIIYLIISFFVLNFYSSQVNAQVNTDWRLLKLDVAGRTIVKGVEVFAQVSTCKDEGVVNLKFVNHNGYPVTVKWFDAMLTQDQKWVKKINPTDQKSLAVDTNKEIKGDCLTNNYSECIIKIKDFIDNPNNFIEYDIYHFEVSAL